MRYWRSAVAAVILVCASAKITQLQKDCVSAGAIYGLGRCWVHHDTYTSWANAHALGCNDLGRKGHLPFMATKTERDFFEQSSVTDIAKSFLSLRQNRTDANNTIDGWQWMLTDGQLLDAVDIPWKWQQPSDDFDQNQIYAHYRDGGIRTVSGWRNKTISYCVYENFDRVQQFTLHMKDRLAYSISDEGYMDKPECALECRKHELCWSFSWKTTDGHCVLSPDDGNFTINTRVNASDYEWFVAVYNFSY